MRARKRSLTLKLYMNNTFVGLLKKMPNGALHFTYDESWVNSPVSIPLSLSLPLTTRTYSGDIVINYFDNLLPDNEGIRKALAQRMSIHSQEVYDLLAAIGRDCVGAVQLIPSEEDIGPGNGMQASPISNGEIATILRNLKSYPLGLKPGDDFRISIAGAQEKTAFLKLDDKWHIPHGTTPSSHIFKVQMGLLRDSVDMSQSVENEWLCLKICKEFGVPVAEAEIADFEDIRTLIVKRFDREFTSKGILRYAQEDFCQVFGVSSSQKYENEGGPGIVKIIETLTKSDNPTEDKTIFMKSQIIFWLLAAIDGHAKNFSVFLVPDGIRITPLYDVMSAHPLIEKGQLQFEKAKLAMAVGDNRHYKIREIRRRHWLQTAKKAQFPEFEMNRVINELIEKTPQVIENVSKILPPGFPSEVADSIFNRIRSSALLLKETTVEGVR